MPSIVHEVNCPYKKATFGMGCFWASDSLFGAQPGVLRTRVGYSGGTTMDPVYRKIEQAASGEYQNGIAARAGSSHKNHENPRGDHTEVIEIDYDLKIISYQDLLELFWNNHEYGLTTIIKRQYMSLILYHDDEQKELAELSMKRVASKINEKLVTEIAPAGAFYPAEDYHQKYRLQQHSWICKELDLTPELLQRSHVAAKLNGYLVGVGTEENFEKDAEKLGLPDKLRNYVRRQFRENAGGSLYC